MLQNAYFLAKFGADTAENEQHLAESLPIGACAGERPRPRVTSAAFFTGLPAFGTLRKEKKSKKKSWPGTDFLDAARSVQKSASPDLDPRACDVFRFASPEANEIINRTMSN